jgi:hypothetical protein
MDFSPDGKLLAVASSDTTLKVCDRNFGSYFGFLCVDLLGRILKILYIHFHCSGFFLFVKLLLLCM